MRSLLIPFALAVCATAAEARIWLIQPDSTGDAPTIQAGVDSAVAGDEVVLAPGNYTSANQGSTGATMVELKPAITLRGAGGSAATTIVSASRALRLVESGSETRIQGLTITGTTGPSSDPSGGGLQILGSGRPTIVDCVFTGCLAAPPGNGGAVMCAPAVEPSFESCVFDACRNGQGLGGAIWCDVATVRLCRFTGNRSYYSGGAVYCGAASFESCEFINNRANGDPGGNGAAIYGPGAIIADCLFEGNVAGGLTTGSGGAVWGASQVADSRFFNNRAAALNGFGGALEATASLTVARCVFAGNQARFGGAIFFRAGSVTECLFVGNSASGAGNSTGGAISANATAVIESCTFLDNRCTPATNVGAISAPAAAMIKRCIVGGTIGQVCNGAPTLSCCNLFGNSGGDAICGVDGGGNFSANPQFCAADPVATLNPLLQADSPCAPGNHPGGADCGLIGVGPVGCGTVAAQLRTWSEIKRLYQR